MGKNSLLVCGESFASQYSLGDEMIWPNDYINKIIHGDCLEIMRNIPDESIDAIITDPPYGISFKSTRQTYQGDIKNDSLEEWQKILPSFLIEFKRVISPRGCCCCCCCGGGKTPVTAIFTMEAIKHFNLIQTLVWRKFVGTGWKYRPAYENIVILSKTATEYSWYDTSKNMANVIENINQDIPTNKWQHPTQKPVRLMELLIKNHTKPGDMVLDPFCGSGTTCEAAKKLGRKYIGIEIESRYIEMAERRLAQDYLFTQNNP